MDAHFRDGEELLGPVRERKGLHQDSPEETIELGT